MEDEVYLIVKSIDLLTADEAEKLPENIRNIDKWYWLLSPGYNYKSAAYVNTNGSVLNSGTRVEGWNAVRPALLIENLDNLDLPLYTELEVFDKEWIYIGDNKALCKDYFLRARFDKKSTDYATSEIKRKLDKWLDDSKGVFEED